MRIDKLLAHCGYGSRKDVKQLLKDGVVVSNGKKIKSSGAHVDPEKDEIYVDGEKIVYLKYVLNTHIPQVIIKIRNDSFNFLGFYV